MEFLLTFFSSLFQADPGKPAAAAQNSSETVLANFFNSLLNKNTTAKPGAPAGTKAANPAGGGGGANRSDVQAELERMSKKSIKKEEN